MVEHASFSLSLTLCAADRLRFSEILFVQQILVPVELHSDIFSRENCTLIFFKENLRRKMLVLQMQ